MSGKQCRAVFREIINREIIQGPLEGNPESKIMQSCLEGNLERKTV